MYQNNTNNILLSFSEYMYAVLENYVKLIVIINDNNKNNKI